MAVYLGDGGRVTLRRTSIKVPMEGVLDPSDVQVDTNRFSFDFDPNALITGDHIEIKTKDGSNLELVAGHHYPDWYGHVYVNDAGGVRLFKEYADALNGDKSKSLPLVAPSHRQPITVRTTARNFRCVAQISDYQLTTTRETVDLTCLGEEYRRNYAAGLISGQGTLTCFWEFRGRFCDASEPNKTVYPHYLAQLVLRTQQGAAFDGQFFINTDEDGRFLWYDASCIVTNCAMSFSPTAPVTCEIQFVTTGPVSLKIGTPPSYLLQEDGAPLLQEDLDLILLEDND